MPGKPWRLAVQARPNQAYTPGPGLYGLLRLLARRFSQRTSGGIVLKFSVAVSYSIHFLLEPNVNLHCGKSLWLRQPEEGLHKRQKPESIPYEAYFALQVPRSWVEDRWVNGVSDNAGSIAGVASEHDSLDSESGGGNLHFQQ